MLAKKGRISLATSAFFAIVLLTALPLAHAQSATPSGDGTDHPMCVQWAQDAALDLRKGDPMRAPYSCDINIPGVTCPGGSPAKAVGVCVETNCKGETICGKPIGPAGLGEEVKKMQTTKQIQNWVKESLAVNGTLPREVSSALEQALLPGDQEALRRALSSRTPAEAARDITELVTGTPDAQRAAARRLGLTPPTQEQLALLSAGAVRLSGESPPVSPTDPGYVPPGFRESTTLGSSPTERRIMPLDFPTESPTGDISDDGPESQTLDIRRDLLRAEIDAWENRPFYEKIFKRILAPAEARRIASARAELQEVEEQIAMRAAEREVRRSVSLDALLVAEQKSQSDPTTGYELFDQPQSPVEYDPVSEDDNFIGDTTVAEMQRDFNNRNRDINGNNIEHYNAQQKELKELEDRVSASPKGSPWDYTDKDGRRRRVTREDLLGIIARDTSANSAALARSRQIAEALEVRAQALDHYIARLSEVQAQAARVGAGAMNYVDRGLTYNELGDPIVADAAADIRTLEAFSNVGDQVLRTNAAFEYALEQDYALAGEDLVACQTCEYFMSQIERTDDIVQQLESGQPPAFLERIIEQSINPIPGLPPDAIARAVVEQGRREFAAATLKTRAAEIRQQFGESEAAVLMGELGTYDPQAPIGIGERASLIGELSQIDHALQVDRGLERFLSDRPDLTLATYSYLAGSPDAFLPSQLAERQALERFFASYSRIGPIEPGTVPITPDTPDLIPALAGPGGEGITPEFLAGINEGDRLALEGDIYGIITGQNTERVSSLIERTTNPNFFERAIDTVIGRPLEYGARVLETPASALDLAEKIPQAVVGLLWAPLDSLANVFGVPTAQRTLLNSSLLRSQERALWAAEVTLSPLIVLDAAIVGNPAVYPPLLSATRSKLFPSEAFPTVAPGASALDNVFAISGRPSQTQQAITNQGVLARASQVPEPAADTNIAPRPGANVVPIRPGQQTSQTVANQTALGRVPPSSLRPSVVALDPGATASQFRAVTPVDGVTVGSSNPVQGSLALNPAQLPVAAPQGSPLSRLPAANDNFVGRTLSSITPFPLAPALPPLFSSVPFPETLTQGAFDTSLPVTVPAAEVPALVFEPTLVVPSVQAPAPTIVPAVTPSVPSPTPSAPPAGVPASAPASAPPGVAPSAPRVGPTIVLQPSPVTPFASLPPLPDTSSPSPPPLAVPASPRVTYIAPAQSIPQGSVPVPVPASLGPYLSEGGLTTLIDHIRRNYGEAAALAARLAQMYGYSPFDWGLFINQLGGGGGAADAPAARQTPRPIDSRVVAALRPALQQVGAEVGEQTAAIAPPQENFAPQVLGEGSLAQVSSPVPITPTEWSALGLYGQTRDPHYLAAADLAAQPSAAAGAPDQVGEIITRTGRHDPGGVVAVRSPDGALQFAAYPDPNWNVAQAPAPSVFRQALGVLRGVAVRATSPLSDVLGGVLSVPPASVRPISRAPASGETLSSQPAAPDLVRDSVAPAQVPIETLTPVTPAPSQPSGFLGTFADLPMRFVLPVLGGLLVNTADNVLLPMSSAQAGVMTRRGLPVQDAIAKYGDRWHTTIASYYGVGEATQGGRITGSGAVQNPSFYHTAHRELPFGTILEVCNGSSCIRVVVNTRGPTVAGRGLDLSDAARRAIGISLGPVEYRVVEWPSQRVASAYRPNRTDWVRGLTEAQARDNAAPIIPSRSRKEIAVPTLVAAEQSGLPAIRPAEGPIGRAPSSAPAAQSPDIDNVVPEERFASVEVSPDSPGTTLLSPQIAGVPDFDADRPVHLALNYKLAEPQLVFDIGDRLQRYVAELAPPSLPDLTTAALFKGSSRPAVMPRSAEREPVVVLNNNEDILQQYMAGLAPPLDESFVAELPTGFTRLAVIQPEQVVAALDFDSIALNQNVFFDPETGDVPEPLPPKASPQVADASPLSNPAQDSALQLPVTFPIGSVPEPMLVSGLAPNSPSAPLMPAPRPSEVTSAVFARRQESSLGGGSPFAFTRFTIPPQPDFAISSGGVIDLTPQGQALLDSAANLNVRSAAAPSPEPVIPVIPDEFRGFFDNPREGLRVSESGSSADGRLFHVSAADGRVLPESELPPAPQGYNWEPDGNRWTARPESADASLSTSDLPPVAMRIGSDEVPAPPAATPESATPPAAPPAPLAERLRPILNRASDSARDVLARVQGSIARIPAASAPPLQRFGVALRDAASGAADAFQSGYRNLAEQLRRSAPEGAPAEAPESGTGAEAVPVAARTADEVPVPATQSLTPEERVLVAPIDLGDGVRIVDQFNVAGRRILVTELPNGEIRPFYESTGRGAPDVKKAGDINPFGGWLVGQENSRQIGQVEGWFIKGVGDRMALEFDEAVGRLRPVDVELRAIVEKLEQNVDSWKPLTVREIIAEADVPREVVANRILREHNATLPENVAFLRGEETPFRPAPARIGELSERAAVTERMVQRAEEVLDDTIPTAAQPQTPVPIAGLVSRVARGFILPGNLSPMPPFGLGRNIMLNAVSYSAVPAPLNLGLNALYRYVVHSSYRADVHQLIANLRGSRAPTPPAPRGSTPADVASPPTPPPTPPRQGGPPGGGPPDGSGPVASSVGDALRWCGVWPMSLGRVAMCGAAAYGLTLFVSDSSETSQEQQSPLPQPDPSAQTPPPHATPPTPQAQPGTKEEKPDERPGSTPQTGGSMSDAGPPVAEPPMQQPPGEQPPGVERPPGQQPPTQQPPGPQAPSTPAPPVDSAGLGPASGPGFGSSIIGQLMGFLNRMIGALRGEEQREEKSGTPPAPRTTPSSSTSTPATSTPTVSSEREDEEE